MALKANVKLSLGLISTTVSVDTAVDKEQSLNTLCVGTDQSKHGPAKTKQSLECPQCGNGDRSTFQKGRDLGDGTFVVVDPDAIANAAPTDAEKTTMPLTTHPAEDVAHHTVPGGSVYFLSQPKAPDEAYPLLVELVKRHPEIAFCTIWAPRSKASMWRLGVFNDALTLTQLAWPADVRQAPTVEAELNEAMVPLAEQFIEQLKAPFDPAAYTNKRAEVLADFIANAEAQAAAEEGLPGATPTTDLLAALQSAVDDKPKPKKKTTKKKAS